MTYKRIEDVVVEQESGEFFVKDAKSERKIARIVDYIYPPQSEFISSLHESGQVKVLYACQDRKDEFNQEYDLMVSFSAFDHKHKPEYYAAMIHVKTLNSEYIPKGKHLMKVKG